MVAPLATSSYAPPDADTLPPLHADGTAGVRPQQRLVDDKFDMDA